MTDTVMVFTSKSLETMRQEGGCGNWAANKARVKHARWLVATRNQKSGWTQGTEKHGNAFLIGKVTGIKHAPAPENDRSVILFEKYAELDLPNAWTGSRNPVAYTDLQTLKIDPDKLEWKKFSIAEAEPARVGNTGPSAVIDRARSMIADAFSISPDAVKITVAL